MKINVLFQSKKPRSSRGVRHMHKFPLHIDELRDTRYSRALNTQLPHVIAERVIHYGVVMDGQGFGQNQ